METIDLKEVMILEKASKEDGRTHSEKRTRRNHDISERRSTAEPVEKTVYVVTLDELEKADEPTGDRPHKAYTRTVKGKAQQIKQKGGIYKKEDEAKPGEKKEAAPEAKPGEKAEVKPGDTIKVGQEPVKVTAVGKDGVTATDDKGDKHLIRHENVEPHEGETKKRTLEDDDKWQAEYAKKQGWESTEPPNEEEANKMADAYDKEFPRRPLKEKGETKKFAESEAKDLEAEGLVPAKHKLEDNLNTKIHYYEKRHIGEDGKPRTGAPLKVLRISRSGADPGSKDEYIISTKSGGVMGSGKTYSKHVSKEEAEKHLNKIMALREERHGKKEEEKGTKPIKLKAGEDPPMGKEYINYEGKLKYIDPKTRRVYEGGKPTKEQMKQREQKAKEHGKKFTEERRATVIKPGLKHGKPPKWWQKKEEEKEEKSMKELYVIDLDKARRLGAKDIRPRKKRSGIITGHSWEGKKVKFFDEDTKKTIIGTVKRVERVPTFSQMVPWKIDLHVEHEGKTYFPRKEDSKLVKARTRGAKDIRPRRKRKTWSQTEVQGPGRRYWFDKKEDAEAFAAERRAKGHAVDHTSFTTGGSVWISHTKKRHSADTRAVMAGIDPLSMNRSILNLQDEVIEKARTRGAKDKKPRTKKWTPHPYSGQPETAYEAHQAMLRDEKMRRANLPIEERRSKSIQDEVIEKARTRGAKDIKKRKRKVSKDFPHGKFTEGDISSSDLKDYYQLTDRQREKYLQSRDRYNPHNVAMRAAERAKPFERS